MHGEHLTQLRDHAGAVVESMVGLGYPTPRWLGTGATSDHVWQLQEFVEGTPATALDERAVTQLLDIVEMQAGRAHLPSSDHAAYILPMVQERAGSTAASRLLTRRGGDLRPHRRAERRRGRAPRADMVHGDFPRATSFCATGMSWRSSTPGAPATGRASSTWPRSSGRCTPIRTICAVASSTAFTRSLDPTQAAAVIGCRILQMVSFPAERSRHDIVSGATTAAQVLLAELESRSSREATAVREGGHADLARHSRSGTPDDDPVK